MTPVGLRVLRILANRPGEVGELARVVLEAEGERAEDVTSVQSAADPLAARREAARVRKAMSRANRVTGVTDVTKKRDRHTSVTSSVTPEIPSPSSSLSSLSPSFSAEISERESESRSGNAREPVTVTRSVTPVTSLVTSLVTSSVTRDGHANDHVTASPGERYVAVTDLITDELSAIAQMVGVQHLAAAWLKFTGHYAGKWVHVAGAWQKWCATEAKHERVERERERERAKNSAAPLTAEGLDPNSYEACQLRKKRRKAEDEAERAELRARLEAQKASAQ
jgi:hypothetical protein